MAQASTIRPQRKASVTAYQNALRANKLLHPTALTNRYNSIFQQNASYSAEELDMVKNCKVTKDGNFVTMIIGEKASDMLTMFNDSIK